MLRMITLVALLGFTSCSSTHKGKCETKCKDKKEQCSRKDKKDKKSCCDKKKSKKHKHGADCTSGQCKRK